MSGKSEESEFSPEEISAAGVTARLPGPPLDALRNRLARAAQLLAAVSSRGAGPALIFRRSDEVVECRLIGEQVVVGRAPGCAVCFEGRQEISRRHFAVQAEGGRFILRDLGSSNGTRVEGTEAPVVERELRDGDLIHAGGLVFLFVKE